VRQAREQFEREMQEDLRSQGHRLEDQAWNAPSPRRDGKGSD
jgi:hypothetical protein